MQVELPEKTKRSLDDFVNRLSAAFKDELVSVFLYGSAASGEFIDKHSNLNLLVMLKNTGLESLKKASGITARFKNIHPLFLTEDDLASSLDIFPIEFLDMQENYRILYGKDSLKNINIDTRNLKFQCEHELKAKLLNLKHLYLKAANQPNLLRQALLKSVASLLHILRNLLRLKGNKPAYLKQDVLKELASEFHIQVKALERVLALKNKKISVGAKEAEALFADFINELEKIVELTDKL